VADACERVEGAYRNVRASGTAIALIISGRVAAAALELAAHHKALHDLASAPSTGKPWTTETRDRLIQTVADASTWRIEFEYAIKAQLGVERTGRRS
jgi:hypothetical protein